MSEQLTPIVNLVTMASAATEYSLALPLCRQFTLQARTANDIYMAFATGLVAGGALGVPTGNYVTIKSGTGFSFPEKIAFKGTIYFACAAPSVVIETVGYF